MIVQSFLDFAHRNRAIIQAYLPNGNKLEGQVIMHTPEDFALMYSSDKVSIVQLGNFVTLQFLDPGFTYAYWKEMGVFK